MKRAVTSRIRFAPLRYRVLCIDGYRWRDGYAIDLPGHPGLRFCTAQLCGRWIVDHYDTGMGLADAGAWSSRRLAAIALLAHAPALTAGGRLAKRIKAAARWIRRARAKGRAP